MVVDVSPPMMMIPRQLLRSLDLLYNADENSVAEKKERADDDLAESLFHNVLLPASWLWWAVQCFSTTMRCVNNGSLTQVGVMKPSYDL